MSPTIIMYLMVRVVMAEDATFVPLPVPYMSDTKFNAPVRRHQYCPEASGRTYALQGQQVSVAFLVCMDCPPSGSDYRAVLATWDSATSRLTGGLLVEVWAEVAKRSGLDWKNSFAVIDYPDNSKGEEFDGLAEWASEHYDVVVGAFTMTPEWSRRQIRFMYPILDASIYLLGVVRTVELPWSVTMWSFLKPFHPLVWIILCVIFLLAALAYRLVEVNGADFPPEMVENGGSWTHALFLAVSSFFDQGKLQPRTNIGRILGVGYLFGLFLLLAAYTANLASMLVSSARDENSVDSMEDAIERRLPICVVRDTTSFRVSIEEYPTLNTVLHDKVDSSFFGDVVEGKCAGLITARYVWDNSKDVGRRNPQCLLGRIGNSIETFPVSFISQSDPYRDFCTGVLSDVVTLTLQEMALEHWISGAEERVNAITADQDCPSSHEVEPSGGALGLKDLMGIFVIQLATCIVVLIGHFFCPWCKDAEDKSKDSESSE